MKIQIRPDVCIKALQMMMLSAVCLAVSFAAAAQSSAPAADPQDEGITIGLLVTENPDENRLMQEAVDAVQLAVTGANRKGGLRGHDVQMVVRPVDGLWGAGSKEAVELITRHDAKALLGFLDGRNAHLVEQVCTKAEIPFISAISPDPTLSRINIPWFFSMMPDAEQQAKALAEHIFRDNTDKSISVITSDDYDQGFTSRYFLEEAESRSGRPVINHSYPSGPEEFEKLSAELSASGSDAIVFFGRTGELEQLLNHPGFGKRNLPIYTPVINLENVRLSHPEMPLFTLKPDGLDSERESAFQDEFSREYGYRPGSYAAYVFDGMAALLEAIKINGTGNHQLQEALREINMKGIHGEISFHPDGVVRQRLTVARAGAE